MIIGIGTDILQIERLQAAYDRTNGRLAEKILGPDEMRVFQQRLARNHKRGIAFLATRFAAKEAFSKLPDGKIPKVKELNEEFARMLSEKKAAYSEYKKIKKEMRKTSLLNYLTF